ncbi:MAG: DsrE family protein [Nitrospira sp.]
MWKRRVFMAALVGGLALAHILPMEGRGEQSVVSAQHRVVMHLNSGEEKVQRGVLNNIRHLFQELGRERLHLELVVHGAGLGLLIKSTTTLGAELAELKADFGVRYTACSNTMKAMKITRDDLVDEVGDTVPAMVRLMERQEQGWAYIKP